MKFRIAWIQGIHCGSLQQNADYYFAECRKLADSKPAIVVLPELCLTEYFAIEEHPRNFDLAIPLSHEVLRSFASIAKEISASIVVPFFEKRGPGIFQNSLVLFGSDGSQLSVYRKSHIPDDPGFYEKYYFLPGDTGFEPTKVGPLSLGTLICWDQWFPEPARILALKGAQLIVYPTAIGWDAGEPESVYAAQLDAWRTGMRAHAIHNRLFVLAVNRTGREGHLDFWGNSFLCGPDGVVLKNCGTTPESCCVEIDLEEIENQRRIWPHFRDRRVEQYSDILKVWCDR